MNSHKHFLNCRAKKTVIPGSDSEASDDDEAIATTSGSGGENCLQMKKCLVVLRKVRTIERAVKKGLTTLQVKEGRRGWIVFPKKNNDNNNS